MKFDDFERRIARSLREQKAVRTPECPETETLSAWVKRGDAHPQASSLLDHVFGCAYCRRQERALQETQAANRQAALTALGIPDAASLPNKIRRWANELIVAGVAAPVRSLRAALTMLTPATTRDVHAPHSLYPADTAVRVPPAVLRWSEAISAPHEIALSRQDGKKPSPPLWRGIAPTPGESPLPITLEPGKVYVWQVTARTGIEPYPSARARFVVLPERTRRQVETLEKGVENVPLARIALYEAHGLYNEAREQAETLLRQNPDDVTAQAIYTKLQERRSI